MDRKLRTTAGPQKGSEISEIHIVPIVAIEERSIFLAVTFPLCIVPPFVRGPCLRPTNCVCLIVTGNTKQTSLCSLQSLKMFSSSEDSWISVRIIIESP